MLLLFSFKFSADFFLTLSSPWKCKMQLKYLCCCHFYIAVTYEKKKKFVFNNLSFLCWVKLMTLLREIFLLLSKSDLNGKYFSGITNDFKVKIQFLVSNLNSLPFFHKSFEPCFAEKYSKAEWEPHVLTSVYFWNFMLPKIIPVVWNIFFWGF